ncbi:serine/threonine-protein phosphatase 7 long form homolog isoform X1 [Castanea sativa]|uniref:serine/threonine-protein phosphatase 7 long form homolog isoform X1 n=1 Tax=Castanea sativa TaxID=21020 RepID=UPI003F6515B6
MKQGVPNNVDTSTELHKITLQGKQEKNWVQEHATHIARWAAHATIAESPPFHGVMSYNDEYMVWYRSITVRHITKETSYWDTLVESQLRIMAKFEPGSEIYTDCMNALQSVEEISRLTLDDVRTAGNASEPAVRHGRQAGGRRGHGGR